MEKTLNKELNAGEKFVSEGKFDKAISFYNSLLKNQPNDTGLLYDLAIVYFLKENYNKTKEVLDKIIATNNKFDKAYYLSARAILYYTNKPKEGIKPILKAIELNKKNSFYFSLASQIYYLSGDVKNALKYAGLSLEKDENNFEAHLVLGENFYTEKDKNKATEHFKKALQNGPDYPDFLFNLNTFYLKIAEKKEFYDLIKQTLIDNKNNEVYKWLYKYAYMRNHPLNKPFILLDNISIHKKFIIPSLIVFIVLIGIMYSSTSFTINFMNMFKWFCSIIFIIFIPYQLIAYLLLNIDFHLFKLPKAKI